MTAMETIPQENMPKKPTVLIIEDEDALIDIYATKLRMNDVAVLTASNGLEGFDVAIQKKPSLILLDVMMPVKDGFETLKDLKMNPATKDIPVIMLTNLGLEHEVRRGLRLGAIKFMTKADLTPEMVAQAVCDTLKKSGAYEQC